MIAFKISKYSSFIRQCFMLFETIIITDRPTTPMTYLWSISEMKNSQFDLFETHH